MSMLEHGHSTEEIEVRFADKPVQNHLRDFIYGGIDGAVTTFAIVAGVEGAGLSPTIIVTLGIANVLADGFSMAAGNYSGTKADLGNLKRIRQVEKRHIAEIPEGEREEVRVIFRKKGLSGKALESVVEAITNDNERWIDLMVSEEYGLSGIEPSPFKAAFVTFSAFLLCGLIPLLPFLLFSEDAFFLSMIATGCTFTLIGMIKSKWSPSSWWWSGLETLAIGAAAAAIAYGTGFLLSGLIPA